MPHVMKQGTANPSHASNRQIEAQLGGSFRDPSGFVFTREGTLYRQVNQSYAADYDSLMSSGLAADLMQLGYLVRHEEVTPRADSTFSGYKLLRPEKVPFISYPYEWCFGQLRDAALTTLRVQLRALDYGMTLKDASAYNVQFVGSKPVLIDTLSFQQLREGQPWIAYRQFCQHFLAPLALMAYRDARCSQLLRVFIDGVPLDLAATLLPATTRLRPALVMHVHLHARMQRKYAGTTGASARQRNVAISLTSLRALIQHLESSIDKLRWEPGTSEWSHYYDQTNYSDAALEAKERLVARVLDELRPETVWDLGANTGRFSRLASRAQASTVAFDLDAAAVENNYRAGKAAGETHLLPLVLDLSNPSPAMGWAAEERQSLEQRGPADLVLALALVHHLAIGNNVPLARIAGFLSRLARRLVIEFVPKTDSQVQRMLSSREDIFDEYTVAGFEHAFDAYFSREAALPIPGTDRTLYVLRRRAAEASSTRASELP
jgi:ribosomal protein L11 methylase PrmA